MTVPAFSRFLLDISSIFLMPSNVCRGGLLMASMISPTIQEPLQLSEKHSTFSISQAAVEAPFQACSGKWLYFSYEGLIWHPDCLLLVWEVELPSRWKRQWLRTGNWQASKTVWPISVQHHICPSQRLCISLSADRKQFEEAVTKDCTEKQNPDHHYEVWIQQKLTILQSLPVFHGKICCKLWISSVS